jgi:phosphopantothenoylcysteine decarboxylase/phosphopantothenate--cysteine ligase
MDLKNKTVILGITGSIAAYKMANVASALAKAQCDVHTIMTQNATEIITPLTFSTLTGHKTVVDTFDKTINYNVAHVSLAKKADALLIAPATANIIAKLAWGLADDMLTTTALACTCPKILSPAMNTAMYENPVVQENLERLKKLGFIIIDPASGILACKDVGKGKLPPEELIIDTLLRAIACEKDLAGKRVLVTAGPTCEAIDPVRFITNRSSGKMGFALAKAAMLRGADVTLVSGPVHLPDIPYIQRVDVRTADEMYLAVTERADGQDIIIKAAAVADFTPAQVAPDKIKKKDAAMAIPLTRTRDILGALGEKRKPGTFLCGFSMETQNLVENSRAKLDRKNADMIVANNVKVQGAGFAGDTNVITIITRDQTLELPCLSKEALAHRILDEILASMA